MFPLLTLTPHSPRPLPPLVLALKRWWDLKTWYNIPLTPLALSLVPSLPSLLAPYSLQCCGNPKTYYNIILGPLAPYLSHTLHPLGLLGPQAALEAFGSLVPFTLLAPSPSPLGLPGASHSLGSFDNLQQPWSLNQTQRPCSPYSPLPLTLCSPLLPGYHGTSGGFDSLQQPLRVFSCTGALIRLRALFPLLSLTPHPLVLPHSLLFPLPPCPLGPLGPQTALGAFSSLGSL